MQFLRADQVASKTSLSLPTIYRKMAEENNPFPKPIQLSKNRVAWIEAEVSAWLESKVKEQRPETAAA